MSDAPYTPPKKKFRVFWWIGGFFVLLFLLFLYQLVGPSPQVVVSKETTYIAEPLLENGLPDYEAYMRAKLREGVTPENNAAVLTWQALWPGELDVEHYEAVAAELGLSEIPSADSALEPLNGEVNRQRLIDWLPKPDTAVEEAASAPDVEAIIGAVQNAAWTGKQMPPLAEWVAANQVPLDLIVEATRRPRYYSPSPTFLDDKHDTLIVMLLPGAQSLRDAARALATRATWHIGENRLREAWQDILAMYRLSDLAAQGPTLVEQLIAMAIRGVAIHTTAVLLSSDQITAEFAWQIQRDLASVPEFADAAKCVDELERLSLLSVVAQARTHGVAALSDMGTTDNEGSPVDYVAIDWNAIMRHVNQVYDKAATAMRVPDRAKRSQAIADLYAEIEASGEGIKRPSRWIGALISRRSRSDAIGTILTSLMVPAVDSAIAAEDRTNTLTMLVRIAAALAVYRAEHGAHPDKLDDLVPGILAKLPVDLYHAKPFVYKHMDQGYLLYTLGENGTDDGGSNEQMRTFEGRELDGDDPAADDALRAKIPSGADDFSIRLPIPTIKLPKPSSPDSATAQ